jgi:hypothetical protein
MNVAAEVEILIPEEPVQPRRAERAAVNVPGGLRKQSSHTLSATVLDLSTHGFRATISTPLQEGAVVWLKLPGLAPQQARIAWAEGLTVGCALTAPLHPAVFDHLVRTLGRG